MKMGVSKRTALGRNRASVVFLTGFLILPSAAVADEGGVSFWLPGNFGSLAAAPLQPGWSLSTVYYHTSVSAGGDVALAREFDTGKVPTNLSATLSARLNADVDLGLVTSTYVFATPVLGGQASIGMMGLYGRNSTSLAGTLTGTLTLHWAHSHSCAPIISATHLPDLAIYFRNSHFAGMRAFITL